MRNNCLSQILASRGVVFNRTTARPVVYALLLLTLSCLLFACAHNKLRLPVEEIRRPLSLPPKNWSVGCGLGAGYYIQKSPDPKGFDLNSQFDLTIPYLTLSRRAELHFTLLNLKYYLLRNTQIIDSTIVCTGPNWALGGGMNGLSYSSDSGFYTSFDLFTDFKLPFNDKIWILSSYWMDYSPTDYQEPDQENHRFDIIGGVGVGCQWNEHCYSTLVATEQYHRLEYSAPMDGPFWITVRTSKWDVRLFNIYSYTGYNINRRWKIYTRPALNFYSDGAIYGSMIVGFEYYW